MDQTSKLGKRLICDDCGTKYYDMNRNPATCPKCGSSKIRKKALKTTISAPITLSVEDEEDLVKDDIELEPLDELEMDSDSDDEDYGDD
ncbi:MAG: TIGR02300 family protein [bacterium]